MPQALSVAELVEQFKLKERGRDRVTVRLPLPRPGSL